MPAALCFGHRPRPPIRMSGGLGVRGFQQSGNTHLQQQPTAASSRPVMRVKKAESVASGTSRCGSVFGTPVFPLLFGDDGGGETGVTSAPTRPSTDDALRPDGWCCLTRRWRRTKKTTGERIGWRSRDRSELYGSPRHRLFLLSYGLVYA
ncbi:hypothetical protein BKA81DRAFT_358102 [Phyllosticta paracitricarpa]